MSATLGHKLGANLVAAIRTANIFDMESCVLTELDAHDVAVWGGVNHSRWNAVHISIKLPRDFGKAWRLCVELEGLVDSPSKIEANAAKTLLDKLYLSLGLNVPMSCLAEQAFLDAIARNPDDLANWSAYSDWLVENGDEAMQGRGELIAALLAKKPIKTKYGIPVMVRKDGRYA